MQKRLKIKLSLLLLMFCSILIAANLSHAAPIQGIYVTQESLENTAFLRYLIVNAKRAGIDTFIVDLELPGKRYANNIAMLKENGIHYVARIIMFPDGAKSMQQAMSQEIWEKKYRLIQNAIAYGASQIQLDYIRFNSKQKPSAENAQAIYKIIRWFKEKLVAQNIPLQVDVFGISSFGESKHIGQNIQLIAQAADVICPMVYPSHYEPYREHAVTPYKTVYTSLTAFKSQFKNQLHFKLVPYIELSNYRYPLSEPNKRAYIQKQIQAAHDAGADGWYAWSPHNRYENLFKVLGTAPAI